MGRNTHSWLANWINEWTYLIMYQIGKLWVISMHQIIKIQELGRNKKVCIKHNVSIEEIFWIFYFCLVSKGPRELVATNILGGDSFKEKPHCA